MALAAYNVTIPVQSPMFHFAPYRDEDVSGVWDAWCPPRAHHDNGKHTKPRVSTTASISWTGTAVYLLGQALPYLYSTSLDGADITHGYRNAEEDLLASYDGLTYGDHTLQVSVVNAQEVHVAAVIITVGIVPEGTTVQSSRFNAVDVSKNSTRPDTFFEVEGAWDIAPADIEEKLNQASIRSTDSGGQVSFNVTNASAFVVHGNLDIDHSTYNVSVTGPHGSLTRYPERFNGSSEFKVESSIVYFSEEAPAFDMTDVVALGPIALPGTTSALVTNSNMGPTAVVGLAIGLTIALLAATGAALIWLRSRRRRYRGPSSATGPAIEYLVDSGKSDITTFDWAGGKEQAPLLAGA